MTPAVSVIIPAYNRSRLLEELVESIWRQDFDLSRVEIIVVDNCCTDDTPSKLMELERRSPCRFIHFRMSENHGPAPARNAAVRRASGEFLAFTDSDCRTDPDWLRSGLNAFAPGVAFVAGAVLNKPEQPIGFLSRYRPGIAAEHASYPTENIFYRREVFVALGGFDENLCYPDVLSRPIECADSDLAWQMIDRGYQHRFCAEAAVYHEVEKQRPLTWLFEPWRLCLVPLLIRRHPAARAKLLHWNLFWYPGSIRFYAASAAVIASLLLIGWKAALAVAVAFWIVRVGVRVLIQRKNPYSLWEWPMLALRNAIMSIALVYGSLRFRCLVL